MDRSAYESKTTDELFAILFAGEYQAEDDLSWPEEGASAALTVLRRRASQEVFDLATSFLRNGQGRERARAMDVLAQLGHGPNHWPFRPQVVPLALEHLRDADPEVVESSAYALGLFSSSEYPHPALLDLHDHPSAGVRLAVARGIGGTVLDGSVPVLLKLMKDPDPEVRNWATFDLGRFSRVDDGAVREALRAGLDDSNEEVRDEALWGLALRGDQDALFGMLTRLEADWFKAGDEEVARSIFELRADEADVDALCARLRGLLG